MAKKPQYPVRIDLDKAKRDTAARDAAKRTPREEREKKAMEKKYPFNRYAEGGKTMMKKAKGGKMYAKGGSVSSRADGCAKKGKTHTTMVKMAKGRKMKGC